MVLDLLYGRVLQNQPTIKCPNFVSVFVLILSSTSVLLILSYIFKCGLNVKILLVNPEVSIWLIYFITKASVTSLSSLW